MQSGQWAKDFGHNQANDRDFLILAIIAFITIGIFYHHLILYLVIGILITYILMNAFYNRSIGSKLYMEPRRQTIRVFQEDQAEFNFELENQSYLPLIHGQFRFQIVPIIKPLEGDLTAHERSFSFYKTLSIRSKGKTRISFPFQAVRRGVTRVRNLSYSFPHLLNFNVLTLKYIPFQLIEVLVFPKLLEVENVDVAFQVSPGEHRVNLSPFEDIQSPVSTREYEFGDPFYRINWKASAKTQQLQTNIYEKVVDISYIFLVNIRHEKEGIQSNEAMEEILSYTSYICQKAFDQKVPYEMYINARTASHTPFLELHEGSGRNHYIRSLEMLARIPRHSMTYSFEKLVYQVQKRVSSPKTIVLIGDLTPEIDLLLTKWSKTQGDIFHVSRGDQGAYMENWRRDVNLRA